MKTCEAVVKFLHEKWLSDSLIMPDILFVWPSIFGGDQLWVGMRAATGEGTILALDRYTHWRFSMSLRGRDELSRLVTWRGTSTIQQIMEAWETVRQ